MHEPTDARSREGCEVGHAELIWGPARGVSEEFGDMFRMFSMNVLAGRWLIERIRLKMFKAEPWRRSR